MSDASTAKAAAAPSSESFESAPPATVSRSRLYIIAGVFVALIIAAAVGLGVGLGLTANNPLVGFPARANIIMPFNMVRGGAVQRKKHKKIIPHAASPPSAP